MKLKILELFCGTKSFSKVFQKNGHDVFTIDFEKKHNPDLCIDVFDLTSEMILEKFGRPHIIWASPPCTHFNIATHRHWNEQRPKKTAQRSIELVGHTLNLILKLFPIYWIMENPRGRLRFVLGQPFKTVNYGAYGHPVLKPTDFWGCFPDINFRQINEDQLFLDWSYWYGKDRVQMRATIPEPLIKHFYDEIIKNLKENKFLLNPIE